MLQLLLPLLVAQHGPCKNILDRVDVQPEAHLAHVVNDTVRLTATLYARCGGQIDGVPKWTTSDTTIATIAPGTGSNANKRTVKVTLIAPGTAAVKATYLSKADSALMSLDTTTVLPPDTSSPPPVASTCAAGDDTVTAGAAIQTVIDAHGTGTSIVVLPGTYANQQVSPKANDTLCGFGAVLDGGRMLTSATSDGAGHWYYTGQTQHGDTSTSTCQPGHDGCQHPEQLWVDDSIYEHVTTLAAVTAGSTKWYFDYSADRIYIGLNPSGHTVVTSVTPWAFGGSATGVTLIGFTVQHYAPPRPLGAMNASGAASWTMDTNTVIDNYGRGIRLGANGKMRWNVVLRNGQMGYQAGGANGLIYGNEFAYNNTAFFGPGTNGETGAGKASSTTNLVFRKNNVHHNHGPGPWFDINNQNALIDSNTVVDNDWRGIFYEISYTGTIRYNTVTGNGFAFPGTYGANEGSGILVSNSSDVEVDHNTVSNNKNGIMGREDNRGSGCCGPYDVLNLDVHDNTVTQTDAGRAAGITSDGSSNPYSTAANNHWHNNTYHRALGVTKWRWATNVDVTESAWRAVQDTGSTFAP